MPRLRNHKKLLRQWLESENWQEHLQEIVNMNPREAIGPLFSFLLLGELMTHKSAIAMAMCVSKLCDEKVEDARNIVRRFMWHMNEESGNIGWGIPEAFAQTLVHCERVAKEFHPVLLSYIMDTGRDDNYCDHAILRRSCYWAVGCLVNARPDICARAVPWLLRGLEDEDLQCRGFAAWALGKYPSQMLDPLHVFAMLRRLDDSRFENIKCSVFDDGELKDYSIVALAKTAIKAHATQNKPHLIA